MGVCLVTDRLVSSFILLTPSPTVRIVQAIKKSSSLRGLGGRVGEGTTREETMVAHPESNMTMV